MTAAIPLRYEWPAQMTEKYQDANQLRGHIRCWALAKPPQIKGRRARADYSQTSEFSSSGMV